MVTSLNRKITTLLIVLAFLISACSSSSYDILSFFFDGVPNPNKKEVAADKNIDSSKVRTREDILKKANPKFVLHGPYRAKLCDDCHNVNQGFKLLKKEPKLCYQCHDNFQKSAKFIHGPVAAGYCTECHHPHRSKNKNLLLKTGQKLCFKCHTESDIKANEDHPDIEGENCVDCHDPHGNDEQYFLRL
ncbi:hypothetical protein MNBD_IGNAVI01-89 [hydrothermal vent metagenome]|uniref:Doubled CXXCH motif domain-containing protein n=1 Tax=hydrothermal vent metagenome TaxID=652676 RepID=A0A3B1CVV0_9ZZZZ